MARRCRHFGLAVSPLGVMNFFSGLSELDDVKVLSGEIHRQVDYIFSQKENSYKKWRLRRKGRKLTAPQRLCRLVYFPSLIRFAIIARPLRRLRGGVTTLALSCSGSPEAVGSMALLSSLQSPRKRGIKPLSSDFHRHYHCHCRQLPVIRCPNNAEPQNVVADSNRGRKWEMKPRDNMKYGKVPPVLMDTVRPSGKEKKGSP